MLGELLELFGGLVCLSRYQSLRGISGVSRRRSGS